MTFVAMLGQKWPDGLLKKSDLARLFLSSRSLERTRNGQYHNNEKDVHAHFFPVENQSK
jgi:hypothetical protein